MKSTSTDEGNKPERVCKDKSGGNGMERKSHPMSNGEPPLESPGPGLSCAMVPESWPPLWHLSDEMGALSHVQNFTMHHPVCC